MDELIFLGTGGGRFTTLFQERATGGLIYKIGDHQIHMDPGPGALLRCKECNVYPFKTDVLIATHPHLDHTNDLNMMIEGTTHAALKQRGTLITTQSVIDEKVVSDYHLKLLKKIILLEPEQTTTLGDLKINAVKCIHSPPGCIGLKFFTPNYCIYYTGDTSIYPGFEKNLKDVDILLANVIMPEDKGLYYHMATNDLISVIKNTKHRLKLIIITHFGTKMLRIGPEKEAERIKEETGVETIAATDSLTIKLTEKLTGSKEK